MNWKEKASSCSKTLNLRRISTKDFIRGQKLKVILDWESQSPDYEKAEKETEGRNPQKQTNEGDCGKTKRKASKQETFFISSLIYFKTL